jgi:hypothetical protein
MARRKIPISERQHGLTTTYKAGCRCDDCTSAASAYARERYKARKAGDVRTSTGERTHGARSTYKAGCRCKPCTEAQSAYNAKKRKEAVEAEPAPVVLDEIRMPVSCPNCGGAVVAQTESAVTGSGMRVTQMLRCSINGCNRQWQFVGVLISLTGAEYMGAA